jgi:hypothetical protein
VRGSVWGLLDYASVARSRRHAFVNGDLQPTWTPAGVDPELQGETLRELRGLSNSIADAYLARDDRIFALALTGRFSRSDIALATGLNKSRVDQIIREMSRRYSAEDLVGREARNGPTVRSQAHEAADPGRAIWTDRVRK